MSRLPGALWPVPGTVVMLTLVPSDASTTKPIPSNATGRAASCALAGAASTTRAATPARARLRTCIVPTSRRAVPASLRRPATGRSTEDTLASGEGQGRWALAPDHQSSDQEPGAVWNIVDAPVRQPWALQAVARHVQ